VRFREIGAICRAHSGARPIRTTAMTTAASSAMARALAGIEALPAGLRDAIRLRAIEERSAESACRELGISEENLFVRVHRARKRLLS